MLTAWVLVLYLQGGGKAIETIPYTYSTKELCREAAREWNSPDYRCFPVEKGEK